MIDLFEIDNVLKKQPKGSFASIDTDSVKKIRKDVFVRTITKNIVFNASTSYRNRVLKQDAEYTFSPKGWQESVEGSDNLTRHKHNGTVYLSVPRNAKSKTSKPSINYYVSDSASGPWSEVSYAEYQDMLAPSARDDYPKKSLLKYNNYKAETITGFRASGVSLEAA